MTKGGTPKYNLSLAPIELITVLKRTNNIVDWPEKMRSFDDQCNKSKSWEFYTDHGHWIDDCIALGLEVTELLKYGHLIDFLTKKLKENIVSREQGFILMASLTYDRAINFITNRLKVSKITRISERRDVSWVAYQCLNLN